MFTPVAADWVTVKIALPPPSLTATLSIEIVGAVSVLENDRWAAAASAVQMQAVAAEVNQLAGRVESYRVELAGALLIGEADQRKHDQQRELSANHPAEAAKATACELMISCELRQ